MGAVVTMLALGVVVLLCALSDTVIASGSMTSACATVIGAACCAFGLIDVIVAHIDRHMAKLARARAAVRSQSSAIPAVGSQRLAIAGQR